MPSTFTWLDYSETDRRKMLDVINAFREKETRDELGLGSVRDAFADLFFPGTSTIQTRARYFLFVPWIYLRLERDRVRSTDIARLARRDEIRLIGALLKGGETGEGDGVIGRRARASLQRLPSNVYWFGLASWGIRRFVGSQDQYHRSLDRYYEAMRARGRQRTEDDIFDEQMTPNWHPGIPDAPGDFLEETTFALTAAEADYVSERIRITNPGSLLAFLLANETASTSTPFPWDYTDALDTVPALLQEYIDHARLFSVVTHGAPLLYNLMLAELTHRDDLIALYRSWLHDWAESWGQQSSRAARWDLGRFWQIVDSTNANVSIPTRRFVERWIDAVRQPGAAQAVADNAALRKLITEREVALKRRLSRLDNPRAREMWNGQSGTGQLNYRWGIAQRILADISDGLAR